MMTIIRAVRPHVGSAVKAVSLIVTFASLAIGTTVFAQQAIQPSFLLPITQQYRLARDLFSMTADVDAEARTKLPSVLEYLYGDSDNPGVLVLAEENLEDGRKSVFYSPLVQMLFDPTISLRDTSPVLLNAAPSSDIASTLIDFPEEEVEVPPTSVPFAQVLDRWLPATSASPRTEEEHKTFQETILALGSLHAQVAGNFQNLISALDQLDSLIDATLQQAQLTPRDREALSIWRTRALVLRAEAYLRWARPDDIYRFYLAESQRSRELSPEEVELQGMDGATVGDVQTRFRDVVPGSDEATQLAFLFQAGPRTLELGRESKESSEDIFTIPFGRWIIAAPVGYDALTASDTQTGVKVTYDVHSPASELSLPDQDRSYLLYSDTDTSTEADLSRDELSDEELSNLVVSTLRKLCMRTARLIRFRLVGNLSDSQDSEIVDTARKFYRWYFGQVLSLERDDDVFRRAWMLMQLDRVRFYQDVGLSDKPLIASGGNHDLRALADQIAQLRQVEERAYLSDQLDSLDRRIRFDDKGQARRFIRLDMNNALSPGTTENVARARAVVLPTRLPMNDASYLYSIRYDLNGGSYIRFSQARNVYAIGDSTRNDRAEELGVSEAYWDVPITVIQGRRILDAVASVYISDVLFPLQYTVPVLLNAQGLTWGTDRLLDVSSDTVITTRAKMADTELEIDANTSTTEPVVVDFFRQNELGEPIWNGQRFIESVAFARGVNEVQYLTILPIEEGQTIRAHPPESVDPTPVILWGAVFLAGGAIASIFTY